ncbi:MAG TPA: hypothetical protein VN176_15410 [Verrucomicrobiae bacterium]|jgi:hypothetical protein|nr:hypothetical protein [Verrucomicrobiae bacterium]
MRFKKNAKYKGLDSTLVANPMPVNSKYHPQDLAELEQCRYLFGRKEAARTAKVLNRLAARQFPDTACLVRFHEALLFLRAFPHSPHVLRKVESLLNSFCQRVEELRQAGADMSAFDSFEVSGIAGTRMSDTLTFDVTRWLLRHVPGMVHIDWKNNDEERAMGSTWPRFIPLLEEDGYVEATIPWREWLQTAQGSKQDGPDWLVQRFEELPLSDAAKAELYDSLRLPLIWNLNNHRISRTRNWRTVRKVFYHDAPLIARSQVSLAKELARRPPELKRLSLAEGRKTMDLVREVMLVRYRELYGTTLGDPAHVVRADLDRGVSIYFWGLPASRRLPLRAYVAGFTLKNGVPVNYIEAIGLCEWIEVGFNTFYTFRGGETAWIYAQALRCLCHLTGATCISVYPYQLGHHNDEAIESGAFWFYRKLGFRPGRDDLARLVEREERRIAAKPGYKTPARTLRRLAAEHVFYELPGSEPGAWDTFSTRNIGMKVNRRMAREFGGNSAAVRRASSEQVARALGPRTSTLTPLEQIAFENLALALAMVPDLKSWTQDEKASFLQVIRAKAGADEMRFLHLTQNHGRLREALLKLGS